jgi:hypothetical protein
MHLVVLQICANTIIRLDTWLAVVNWWIGGVEFEFNI